MTSFNAATIADIRKFAPRVETGLLIGRGRGIRKTIADLLGRAPGGSCLTMPHSDSGRRQPTAWPGSSAFD